jgi:hypothetical protein
MKEIKLPIGGFTDEHKSADYFNRLIGKSIMDSRFLGENNKPFIHSKIVGCIRAKRTDLRQNFPDELAYKKEDNTEIIISWLVAVELIEGGFARDAYGFEYAVS